MVLGGSAMGEGLRWFFSTIAYLPKLPCPTLILITGNVKFYPKNTMYRQHFHIIGTVIYYTST